MRDIVMLFKKLYGTPTNVVITNYHYMDILFYYFVWLPTAKPDYMLYVEYFLFHFFFLPAKAEPIYENFIILMIVGNVTRV